MNRAQIEKKMDELVENFHNNDLDAVGAMFAENAVGENFTGQGGKSRQEIVDVLKPYFAGEFGEMHFDVSRIDVDEERQVCWTTWVMSLTKDGVKTSFPGVDTFEFEGELIIRNSVYVKSLQPLII